MLCKKKKISVSSSTQTSVVFYRKVIREPRWVRPNKGTRDSHTQYSPNYFEISICSANFLNIMLVSSRIERLRTLSCSVQSLTFGSVLMVEAIETEKNMKAVKRLARSGGQVKTSNFKAKKKLFFTYLPVTRFFFNFESFAPWPP